LKELTAQTEEKFTERYLKELGQTKKDKRKKSLIHLTKDEERKGNLRSTNPELYRQLARDVEDGGNPHAFVSENGKYIYHIGIIDYLQEFNWEKWIENQYKQIKYGGERITIVPPKDYAYRQFGYLQAQVIINQ